MATKKQTKTLISKPFQYNVGLETQYKRELSSLANAMLKDITERIASIYRANKSDISFAMDGIANDMKKVLADLRKKYERIFRIQGTEYAKKMVMRQLRQSRVSFQSAMKELFPEESLVISGSVLSDEMKEVVEASIMENVSLIKSIPEQYLDRVAGAVTRSIQAGGSIKQLKQEIVKYNGMTRRRADNIALDQTRKTYTSINLRNMQKYGIKKVKWIHSGGGQHPRSYHLTRWDGKSEPPNGLNGYVFDIDRPPIIQRAEGNIQEIRGYPAQLPNCKCTMAAVVEIEPV